MRLHGTPLDERKQKILKAIVHEHVESAEPVGSEMLAVRYDFGVRSATIRNEMADMADMGYLRQPHTSAGRIPSDLGYRFYVDELMDAAILPQREVARARRRVVSASAELEHIISQTCRILTGLTQYTSVATQPVSRDTTISYVNLSKVGGRKLLLLAAISDGRVEHRMLDPGREVTAGEAARASNLLASRFVGNEIEAVGRTDADAEPAAPDPIADICAEAIAILRQMAESLSLSEAEVCVEGTSYMLRQPEFQDLARLEGVLALLQERKRLYDLMSRIVLGPDVTVVIGSENPCRELQSTSFVAVKYRVCGRQAGTIGVIGPTRMDYRHAVAAVEAMARNLGDLLTILSLS